MEKEENKKVCCENKEGVACEHGMSNCCHNWKKCHMVKRIVIVLALVIAFCLGSQWGEIKGELRGSRFQRGEMMNWGEGRYDNRFNKVQTATDEVTVKVEGTQAPTTTTPKQ